MTNLWVTPADLGSYGSSAYADDACQMASNILWAMSGRKYSGTMTVTERYITSINAFRYQGASAKNFFPQMVGGTVYNIPSEDWNDSAYESDGTSALSRIRLRGKPVQEIHLVRSMYNGKIIPEDTYYLAEHSTLIAYKGTPWPPGNLEVSYTYGSYPPTAGRYAARILATELIKYFEGEDCLLPDRVTSIARQGITYTILDNQDFLENMRTGIYVIDLFLKTANPSGALAQSKIFSPDIPRPRRAAPPRALTLPRSAAYDIFLNYTNKFDVHNTYSLNGELSPLLSYNNTNYSLRLDVVSWSGTVEKTYDHTNALFRTSGSSHYLDLHFDYATTFSSLGPNDPGIWILYAVDNSGATIELLTGNIQIQKIVSSQVKPKQTMVDIPTKLICKQGETFTKTVTWSTDGILKDLTGYTAAMQVRSSYSSASPVVSLNGSNGLVLGGTAGTIQITINNATTSSIPAGNYVYDLELTSGSTVTRLLEGQFIVTPEVTR